jgi:hypothetical protein
MHPTSSPRSWLGLLRYTKYAPTIDTALARIAVPNTRV